MSDFIKVTKISDYNIHLKKGKCTYCENSLVIHRKYSGEYLCPSCFEKSIEKKIYKTFSKYKLLKRQDRIIVGLSGGKDSVSHLYNLKMIQEKTHNSEPLIALTIDEGIKDYRNNSIKNARNICKELDVEHKVISFKKRVGRIRACF